MFRSHLKVSLTFWPLTSPWWVSVCLWPTWSCSGLPGASSPRCWHHRWPRWCHPGPGCHPPPCCPELSTEDGREALLRLTEIPQGTQPEKTNKHMELQQTWARSLWRRSYEGGKDFFFCFSSVFQSKANSCILKSVKGDILINIGGICSLGKTSRKDAELGTFAWTGGC